MKSYIIKLYKVKSEQAKRCCHKRKTKLVAEDVPEPEDLKKKLVE